MIRDHGGIYLVLKGLIRLTTGRLEVKVRQHVR